MAYSSWTSDLKTRSSVGFLGKVVNLLVQAKDRVDENHTTLAAQNNMTAAGKVTLTKQMTSSAQITGTLVNVFTSGASDAAQVISIADGTADGEYKKIVYSQQNAAKTVKVDFGTGSDGLVGHNSSTTGGSGPATVQFIIFSDQAEWAEIVWDAASSRWFLGAFSGITH